MFVAAYTYGYNIRTVAYAPGDHSTWEDLMSNAPHFMAWNTQIAISTFTPGATYTFCFRLSDDTDVFVVKTIGQAQPGE